ncbi:hypothetical protein HU200_040706 [Digitaria exilis]|uniref:Uncharacterized protein n=1 Tax=Digitaria exilis TaxID=1010633 RepID=A0A835EIX6_9POAL|nr:hypothetical protein HU200_040706 [Digitaria exilis]
MPRLTAIAIGEKDQVDSLRAITTLTTVEDRRLCPFATSDGKLHTGPLYQLLLAAHQSPSLSRETFFAWLLVQEHMQARANLVKKNVFDSAICEICCNASKTATHIIFELTNPVIHGLSSSSREKKTTVWLAALAAALCAYCADSGLRGALAKPGVELATWNAIVSPSTHSIGETCLHLLLDPPLRTSPRPHGAKPAPPHEQMYSRQRGRTSRS